MANSGQSIQFFCSKCNTLIRETAYMDRSSNVSEDCPACGSLLSDTMQTTAKKRARPAAHLQPLQTAYEIKAALKFGMKGIDSFLALHLGDRLCIAGNNANLFVARLCIQALMPIRQGGIDAQSIIFIDAGNNSDIYQCVSFARQLGLEVQKVLSGIVVSRAFTIHQLAGVIAHELPQAIRQFNSKLVVISDLLKMFTQDPQISKGEAGYLINEIMASLNKITDVMMLLSIQDESPYNVQILKAFGKRIEIAKKGGELCIMLCNHNRSKQALVPEKELRVISC
jgi:hypothetical protein